MFRAETQGERVMGAGELSGGRSSEGSRHGDPGSSWSVKMKNVGKTNYIRLCVCLTGVD